MYQGRGLIPNFTPGTACTAGNPYPEGQPGGRVEYQERTRCGGQVHLFTQRRQQPQQRQGVAKELHPPGHFIKRAREQKTGHQQTNQRPRHRQAQQFMRKKLKPNRTEARHQRLRIRNSS